jgi:hypothetical protein
MLSMSRAESVVFMWGSSAAAFRSQASAYDFERASQARSSARVTGM